jgi:hypothetical protein
MAAQDPAPIIAPDGQVSRVGIVAQNEMRRGQVQLRQAIVLAKQGTPNIVYSQEDQAGHGPLRITQHLDAEVGQPCRQIVADLHPLEVTAIIMIAEHGHRRQASGLQMLQNPQCARYLLGPLAGHEIAGQGHDIRLQLRDALQGVAEILVLHNRAGVQVAELNESAADQLGRQPRDGQLLVYYLNPMQLHARGVAIGTGSRTAGRTEGLKEAAPAEEGGIEHAIIRWAIGWFHDNQT